MNPTAYPLQWPEGWPRTAEFSRQTSRFKTTLPQALSALETQVRLLRGRGLVLSSNYTLGSKNPKDPGVVAYFTHDQTELAVPCDRWTKIEDNVYAIALTIGALRGMDRWGAKHMIKAMFSGFKALPPSSDPKNPKWWEVLGCLENSTWTEVTHAYRTQAQKFHPDRGGTHEDMLKVNHALHLAKKAHQIP